MQWVFDIWNPPAFQAICTRFYIFFLRLSVSTQFIHICCGCYCCLFIMSITNQFGMPRVGERNYNLFRSLYKHSWYWYGLLFCPCVCFNVGVPVSCFFFFLFFVVIFCLTSRLTKANPLSFWPSSSAVCHWWFVVGLNVVAIRAKYVSCS